MNIDLLNTTTHKSRSDYIDTLTFHGYLPLITQPTHVIPTSATLIHHILSKFNPDLQYTPGTNLPTISHYPYVIQLYETQNVNVDIILQHIISTKFTKTNPSVHYLSTLTNI